MSIASFSMTPEINESVGPELRSVMYATFAYLHPRKPLWRVPIQGRIYTERPASFSQRVLLRGLQRALKITPEQAQGDCFRTRVGGFLTTPEPGERIRVDCHGTPYRLRSRSRSSGMFQSRIDIPRDQFEASVEKFTLTSLGNFKSSEAPVFLSGASGISIVTDIDDTIKLTDVTSRSRMLARTFLEEFEPIDGMSELYRDWAEQGSLFHYVSSSPWQIYQPLCQFLVDHGFPQGSMHLKWFRLRDEFFKRWSIVRRKSKGGVISSMIKRMPYRRFLLVGDSGERDPEIYAKIAKRFPYQVVGCLIRDLEARPIDGKRHDALRKKLGIVPLTLFREPREISDALERAQRVL